MGSAMSKSKMFEAVVWFLNRPYVYPFYLLGCVAGSVGLALLLVNLSN